MFKCESCEKTFSCNDNLIRHQKFQHNTTDLLCESCGKCFKNFRNFQFHQKKHHTIDSTDKRHYDARNNESEIKKTETK